MNFISYLFKIKKETSIFALIQQIQYIVKHKCHELQKGHQGEVIEKVISIFL